MAQRLLERGNALYWTSQVLRGEGGGICTSKARQMPIDDEISRVSFFSGSRQPKNKPWVVGSVRSAICDSLENSQKVNFVWKNPNRRRFICRWLALPRQWMSDSHRVGERAVRGARERFCMHGHLPESLQAVKKSHQTPRPPLLSHQLLLSLTHDDEQGSKETSSSSSAHETLPLAPLAASTQALLVLHGRTHHHDLLLLLCGCCGCCCSDAVGNAPSRSDPR